MQVVATAHAQHNLIESGDCFQANQLRCTEWFVLHFHNSVVVIILIIINNDTEVITSYSRDGNMIVHDIEHVKNFSKSHVKKLSVSDSF